MKTGKQLIHEILALAEFFSLKHLLQDTLIIYKEIWRFGHQICMTRNKMRGFFKIIRITEEYRKTKKTKKTKISSLFNSTE